MKRKYYLITLFVFIICISFIVYLDKGEVTFQSERNEPIIVEYGQDYDLPKITAYYTFPYFNKQISLKTTTTNNIDNTKLGTYKITYTASFLFKKMTNETIVHIVDTTSPTIILTINDDYYIFPNEEYIEEGFQATDNYDGDITNKVEIINNNDGTITYTVTDSSNNTTAITRTIKYKDNEAPVLTINASYLAIKLNSSFSIPSYTAIDAQDGDLTSQVKVTNNINRNKVGLYTITYAVSDRWGNNTLKTIDAYVYQKQINNVANNPNGKNIYLTFDDGPSGYTKTLLNTLDKYNVKVTFFIGNHYHNAIIGEEYRKGHTIAVHTYTHNYGTIYSSSEAFWNDIDKINSIIYQQTGSYSHYLRFPGGSSNTVSRFNKGIMTTLVKESKENGYIYFDWNVSSGDAGETTSAYGVYQNVIKGCAKKTNSIVLQHDIKGYSVAAVERIILWGLCNGYTFLPITDTTYPAHHRINN